jgi:DNA-binding transcriptional ArsR family regulator
MAEAAGLDHATVGLALTTLREEDSPVVVRTRVGELVDADTYELVVPDKHAALTRLRWRSGGIRRIHPLFRVLRGPAFLVWEALAEAGGVPAAVFDVAAATGLSPTAVREALRTFGELGLVEHDGDGWIIVGRLGDAAEQLGADQIAERVRLEHVRDREAWRVVVRRMILREKIAAAWWEQEPPPPTDDPRWEEMDRAVTLFDSAVA